MTRKQKVQAVGYTILTLLGMGGVVVLVMDIIISL
jgi:hypothetical protein